MWIDAEELASRRRERRRKDVMTIRASLPDLMGDRSDQEIEDLYSYYSHTRYSAGWLRLNTDAFGEWFRQMQHMFR
jgi:cytochrome c553